MLILFTAGLTMLSTVYTDPESRSTAMAVAASGLTFGLIGKMNFEIKIKVHLTVYHKLAALLPMLDCRGKLIY